MTTLCGKGIWLAHSYDLQRAAEVAASIGGTHLLVKVGHGPAYFPEVARSMVRRVRSLGFSPIAWVEMTDRAGQDAAKAVAASIALDYEAAVLFIGQTALTVQQVRPLARSLDGLGLPRQRLWLATPPLPYLADRDVLRTLVPQCQGGWMPLCFQTWGDDPEQVIDRDVYQALGDLSRYWGKTPSVYPVLSPHRSQQSNGLLPEEFIPWTEAVARHGIDFFSVYHSAALEKALWPMLASVNIPCMETGEHVAVADSDVVASPQVSQPVYITASTSDTVWGLITRHGITKQQFWTWNAHLWDSRGLPRDPDYLQEGWRLRVK